MKRDLNPQTPVSKPSAVRVVHANQKQQLTFSKTALVCQAKKALRHTLSWDRPLSCPPNATLWLRLLLREEMQLIMNLRLSTSAVPMLSVLTSDTVRGEGARFRAVRTGVVVKRRGQLRCSCHWTSSTDGERQLRKKVRRRRQREWQMKNGQQRSTEQSTCDLAPKLGQSSHTMTVLRRWSDNCPIINSMYFLKT